MITDHYFITAHFGDDRPNIEIIFSDKDLFEVKRVIRLISDYQQAGHDDRTDLQEEIRETLEDVFGVNTSDLDVADIDPRIYVSREVQE